MDRRAFLQGAAASAIAAALPAPIYGASMQPSVLPDLLPMLRRTVTPIYFGVIGEYHGIVIRESANAV